MTEDKALLRWLNDAVKDIIQPDEGRNTKFIALCVGYDDDTVKSGYYGCSSVELATAAGIVTQDGAELRRWEAEEEEKEEDDND